MYQSHDATLVMVSILKWIFFVCLFILFKFRIILWDQSGFSFRKMGEMKSFGSLSHCVMACFKVSFSISLSIMIDLFSEKWLFGAFFSIGFTLMSILRPLLCSGPLYQTWGLSKNPSDYLDFHPQSFHSVILGLSWFDLPRCLLIWFVPFLCWWIWWLLIVPLCVVIFPWDLHFSFVLVVVVVVVGVEVCGAVRWVCFVLAGRMRSMSKTRSLLGWSACCCWWELSRLFEAWRACSVGSHIDMSHLFCSLGFRCQIITEEETCALVFWFFLCVASAWARSAEWLQFALD